jgi:hypothetical protein
MEVVVDADSVPTGGELRSISPHGSDVAVAVVLPPATADRLADLLDAWSAYRHLFG